MNEQLLLELLKQDAFVMEIAGYNKPWLPDDEGVIVDVYRSFAQEMFGLLGKDFFSAMIIEVPSLGRKPIALSSLGTTVSHISIEGEVRRPTVEWLWEQASAECPADDMFTEIREWRENKGESADFYFAPYIVQKLTFDGFPPSIENARNNYKGMTSDIRSKFLYTKPELVSTCTAKIPFPSDGYYKAAWLIGVTNLTPEQAMELIYNIESFSILFHMSWGYPHLIDEKEKSKQIVLELDKIKAEVHYLRKLEEASELAKDLMAAVGPLTLTSQKLSKVLTPSPDAILFTYRLASRFIPERPEVKVYDEWIFRHDWSPKTINRDSESFRAQFACILLSYLAEDLPPEDQEWPKERDKPWLILKKIYETDASKIPVFDENFIETVRAVLDDSVSRMWNDDDETSFTILKGCFHNPFKDPSRVTGPLTALWVLERKGTVKNPQFLYRTEAASGEGWPDNLLLAAIHGLFMDEQAKSPACSVEASAVQRGELCVGATIKIFDCRTGFTEKIEEEKNLYLDRKSEHRGSVEEPRASATLERRGNLRRDVGRVLEHRGTIECDLSASTVTITFGRR
jgi:hypothetical protein